MKTKRIFAILITLAMMSSLFNVTSFAATEGDTYLSPIYVDAMT